MGHLELDQALALTCGAAAPNVMVYLMGLPTTTPLLTGAPPLTGAGAGAGAGALAADDLG